MRWEPEGWRAEARALLLREGDILELALTDQARPGFGDAALYTFTIGPRFERLVADATFVFDHDERLENRRLTGGVFSKWQRNRLSARVEGYLQLGEREEQRVRAGMLGVAGTWRSGPAALTLQYDVLSGDRTPDDDLLTAFDPLVGAHHAYYGLIDMAFVRVGGFADRQGLHDLALKGSVKPSESSELLLDLHGFFAAAPADEAFLAFEPDLIARYRIRPSLGLSVGTFLWVPPQDAVEWSTWAMLDARL